jgi:pyridoxamine 5'-phosphate oxidase
MLIIKDIDGDGYHFSTHRTSRKGVELAAHPQASMLFFWRESGRQVRVTGTVVALDEAVSQRDWAGRPNYDGTPNPDWQRYALVPSEYEFMQAQHDRNHQRIEYRLGPAGSWSHGRVTSPAG